MRVFFLCVFISAENTPGPEDVPGWRGAGYWWKMHHLSFNAGRWRGRQVVLYFFCRSWRWTMFRDVLHLKWTVVAFRLLKGNFDFLFELLLPFFQIILHFWIKWLVKFGPCWHLKYFSKWEIITLISIVIKTPTKLQIRILGIQKLTARLHSVQPPRELQAHDRPLIWLLVEILKDIWII